MTTYDRPTRERLGDETHALQANRLQWRDAESEWLRAEDALREFQECTATYSDELLATLAETAESLRFWRDEARERVIELDQGFAAMCEMAAREAAEGAQQ